MAIFAITQEWKELESCSFHDYTDKSVLYLFIKRYWKVLQIQSILINNLPRSSLQFFQVLYEHIDLDYRKDSPDAPLQNRTRPTFRVRVGVG